MSDNVLDHVALRALYFHDPAALAIGCAIISDNGSLDLVEASRAYRDDAAQPSRADGFDQRQVDAAKAVLLSPAPSKPRSPR